MRTYVIRVAVLGTLSALLAGVGCKKQKPKPPEPDPEFEQLRSNLVHAALANLIAPPSNQVTWARAAQPAQVQPATATAAQPVQSQPATALAAEVSRSSAEPAERTEHPENALAKPPADNVDLAAASSPAPEHEDPLTSLPKAKPITVRSSPSQPNSALGESTSEGNVGTAQQPAEPIADEPVADPGRQERGVEATQAADDDAQEVAATDADKAQTTEADNPQTTEAVAREGQHEAQKTTDRTEVAVRRAISSAFSAQFGAGFGFTGDTAGANGFTGIGAGPGHTGIGAGPGSTGIGAGPGHTGVGAGPGDTGIGAGRGFTGVSAGDWGFTGIAGSRAPQSMDATSASSASSPTLEQQGAAPNQGKGAVIWLTPWGLVLLPVGAR